MGIPQLGLGGKLSLTGRERRLSGRDCSRSKRRKKLGFCWSQERHPVWSFSSCPFEETPYFWTWEWNASCRIVLLTFPLQEGAHGPAVRSVSSWQPPLLTLSDFSQLLSSATNLLGVGRAHDWAGLCDKVRTISAQHRTLLRCSRAPRGLTETLSDLHLGHSPSLILLPPFPFHKGDTSIKPLHS